MNLTSCANCGIVIDLKHAPLIELEVPQDPEDNKRDEDGYYITNELMYNPDLVWGGRDSGPLDTWKCPLCQTLNGIKKD